MPKIKTKLLMKSAQTVAVYQSQITLGKIINVLLHEARRPLSYFRNRIPYLKRRYNSFQKNGDLKDLEKAMDTVDGIAENSQFFVNLFKRLDPLATGKRIRKKPLELKKTIENVFSVFENEMKSHNISAAIKCPDEFKFPAWHQDIYAIFTNLVDNSLYWISQKNSETREITIEFLLQDSSLIHIDYKDTGPGIETDLIESEVIFEPHFSTKPDGTGLGLAIAAEAADRSGLELKAFESKEGAHFRLQPKMEGEKVKKLRLLIVEDVEQELESFRDDLEDYTREKKRDIELVECKTLEDALDKLDNSFDGAIIDLKLANHRSNEGSQVIEKIRESFFRIPIAIFTGNPGDWNHDLNEKTMLIDVFTKGETGYYELLDRFWEIYNTGLTHIMGGRGLIEQQLSEVFLKNLLPQIQAWVSYGTEDSERTEKALLRYALNHLFQLLEEDEERYFPEEFYLHPPVSKEITTGSIVKEKSSDQSFIVLSPACDLVIRRNGEFKNRSYPPR